MVVRRQNRSIDGVVLVDKPSGVTSHDVVLAVRRALDERRVGHAGTLDPFATGLLVLLVGRATRLLPYIDAEPKVYEGTVHFGLETDTDDPVGTPVRTAAPPSESAVRAAIDQLTGELLQLPPAYSAKHVGGRRAYQAARAGNTVNVRPVTVRVDSWRITDRTDEALDFVVTCGGGTYVRALARDLGRLSGSAAHLARLRRLRSGPFSVEDAIPLARVRERDFQVRSPLDALASLPTERLDGTAAARVRQGLEVEATTPGARGALIDDRGELVALAERRGGRWQPRVVMQHD